MRILMPKHAGNAAPAHTWEFEGAHGRWYSLHPAADAAVKAALQQGLQQAKASFINDRTGRMTEYVYDLNTMHQQNRETGFRRKIRSIHAVNADRPAVGSATKRSWHDVEAPGAASNVPDLPRRILFSAAALRASTASLSFKDVTKWVKVDVSGISKDASCCICLCSFEESDVDEPCIRFGSCTGHYFHLSCVNTGSFFRNGFVKCPVCTNIYGKMLGLQPDGIMTLDKNRQNSLPGFPGRGTIEISYHFQDGIQVEGMPSPGTYYSGTRRIAFLPDTKEGVEVALLLCEAFRRGLIFQVGTSVTNGTTNTTVWNGIHHKTNAHGGTARHGYPDDEYLSRVRDELAAKGVV